MTLADDLRSEAQRLSVTQGLLSSAAAQLDALTFQLADTQSKLNECIKNCPPSPPPPPPPPPPSPGVGLPKPLYSATSFWNVPIPPNPELDPNSAAVIAYAIAGVAGTSNLSNTDTWGMPVYVAKDGDKLYSIGAVQTRIPAGARPKLGSDHHMIVIDGDKETDMWLAAYDSVADKWTATFVGQSSVSGWGALCAQGQRCNAAVAAGFAAAGGIIRPDEIADGVIKHALVMATPHTRSGVIACPATHTDGKESRADAIPEGARIQLDPAFVIPTAWAPYQKIIAKALQVYGAYIGDTGGSLEVRGEAADLDKRAGTWGSVGVPLGPGLGFIPWSRCRLLKYQTC